MGGGEVDDDLVGVGGVVEPADEVVGGGEEQFAGDGVDDRVRAPETCTSITVWPIMAQPPIPPKKPVTMFAMPWR